MCVTASLIALASIIFSTEVVNMPRGSLPHIGISLSEASVPVLSFSPAGRNGWRQMLCILLVESGHN